MALQEVVLVDEDEDNTPPTALTSYAELPVYGVPAPDRKWSIDGIVRELDNGQFVNAGRLGDTIQRDGRILGALEQRNAGLFGAPLTFTPADEESAQAAEISEEIEAGWEAMFPRAALEELHQYAILQGIGIAEKVWDTSTTPWTFRIEPYHPQFYTWRWDLGMYTIITKDRGLVNVPQRSTQWLTLAPYGYRRAYLRGRLRALVDPWMMRGWTKNDWAHWCEIHGKPIRKAIVPQQADPKQEKEYVNSIANISNNTTIKCRQDKDGNKYDLELVEAVAEGWSGFDKMLAWCDHEITNVILGQSQSTDGQGGLGAQEKPGDAVRSDIKAADNAKLCEALYTQGLRDYCEFNYGDPDLAPRPSYQVEPEEDEAHAADADQKVAAALVSFKTAEAPLNVRDYLEERGYPLLTEEEEAAQKEQAKQDAQDAADYAAQAAGDAAYVDSGVATPEEVALSRFGSGRGLTLDLEARRKAQALTIDDEAPQPTKKRKRAPKAP